MKQQIFKGAKFGWWVIIDDTLTKGNVIGKQPGKLFAKVRCKCGKEWYIYIGNLLKGRSTGCRSCHSEGSGNGNWTGYKDLSGKLWHHIYQAAKVREIPFRVSKLYIRNLLYEQKFKCALTGQLLDWNSASLDRINSAKPYEKGNLQWVLKDINVMKQSYSQQRFVELCIAVCAHTKSSK